MTKAIILSRVSTQQQNLEQQTQEVLKEVYKDGFKTKDIIILEDKESAIKLSEEERNGLNRMKQLIESDSSISTVYLYELSRLSRRQLVLFSIRDFLVQRKIQLICLKPYFRLLDNDGTLSQTGSLMFSLFSSLSESEMILKKERMMRGRKYNLAMGKSGGGKPPFGYTTDREHKYIPHPTESLLIKRLFYEYVNSNKSMRTMTKEWKEEGLFPNTCFLSLNNSMNYWMKQKYYTGNKHFPALISKSLYDKAQKVKKDLIFATRYKYNHPKKKQFLLKGLIRDEHTNLILSANSAGDTYYSRRYKGASIFRKNIDPLIWDFSYMMYEKYVANQKTLRKKINKDLELIIKKMTVIEEEIKDIKNKIDKAEERMIFGNLSESKGEEIIHKLKELLNEAEKRQLSLVNQNIAKQQQLVEVDFFQKVEPYSLSYEEKLDIVNKIIDKITIWRIKRTTARIKIFNKINDEVDFYEIYCWKQQWKKIGQCKRKDLKNPIKTDFLLI